VLTQSARSSQRVHPAALALLIVCVAMYAFSLVVAIGVLIKLRSASAVVVLGGAVVVGVVLTAYVVVVSRRDPARRRLVVPLSVSCVAGTLMNFIVIGMTAVLSTLGG
jgi:hypothetical protein